MTLNKFTKGVVQVDYWFGKLVVHNLTFPQSDWFEDHIDLIQAVCALCLRCIMVVK